MTSHFDKQCLSIVEDYRRAGGAWPAKKNELAEWALSHNRWQPSRDDVRRMCAAALAEAMREEVFVDESGREVRAKIPARTTRADGEQGTFWDDLRTAPIQHVRVGVAQRRTGITGECYHLRNIVRYSNEHRDEESQIALSLDFTKDVLEMDQPMEDKRRTTVRAPSSILHSPRVEQPQPAAPPSVSRPVPSRPSSRPDAHV